MDQKIYAEPILVVIAGPTAVGKTELCLKLARELDTEILSADSRQFYKEMNIGTAKPSGQELEQVKHYFINSHSITEEYSCGAFESDALHLLGKLFQKKPIVILTGGSGLYIQAVYEGLNEMPETEPALRQKLINQLEAKGLESLLKQLAELDPVYYQQVDHANPQRIIRALEVCYSSGKPYSFFRGRNLQERPFKTIKIGLNRDRPELYQRIDQRMDQMLAAGLLEEAKQLYAYRSHNALQTVGYKEIFDFLEEKQDWEETVRLLKRNSRRYAKRQLTWFGRDSDFKWFHPEDWKGITAFIAQSSG